MVYILFLKEKYQIPAGHLELLRETLFRAG